MYIAFMHLICVHLCGTAVKQLLCISSLRLPSMLMEAYVDKTPCLPLFPTASPLEGYSANEWVMFENVLVLKDLALGGGRTFASQQDAKEFRALIYQQVRILGNQP